MLLSLTERIFQQIAIDWKSNKISYAIALHRLCEIGWSLDQAGDWLAKN